MSELWLELSELTGLEKGFAGARGLLPHAGTGHQNVALYEAFAVKVVLTCIA